MTYVKPAAFQAATILTDGGGCEEWRFLVEVVKLSGSSRVQMEGDEKSAGMSRVLTSRDIASIVEGDIRGMAFVRVIK
jgi:hypothetical protein